MKNTDRIAKRLTSGCSHCRGLRTLLWCAALFWLAGNAGLDAQVVETHGFTNLFRAIPDGNTAGLSDGRNLASAIGAITAVKVRLKVTGEFNGDLYAYLRHTNGFVVLLNRPGRTASNSAGYADSGLDVTFQDGAPNGDVHLYQDVTGPADGSPLTGAWAPDGRAVDPGDVTDGSERSTSLTNFNGLNAAGEWTLYLADVESGGTNQLAEWSLEITGAAYPTLVWTNPADITYGTALSETQLNATASYGSTNVNGTFSYSPPLGTVLSAGSGQSLSVTFTPSDTADFLSTSTNVTVNVLAAPVASNQPPVFAAIPVCTALPDQLFMVVLKASDPDGNDLAFSLGAGAPAGAYITNVVRRLPHKPLTTNTVVAWLPSRAFASTTNYITVIVTGNGSPPLSATQTVTVIVLDYLELSVGMGGVQPGQTASVPIQLASSDGVTNLEFVINWPVGSLSNAALAVSAPEIASASLQDQITNVLISLYTTPGQVLQNTQQIAQLTFSGMSIPQSALVSLPVTSISATKPDSSPYTNYITDPGTVGIIISQPLLLALISSSQTRNLDLFGEVGAEYQLQYSTNLQGAGAWYPLANYTQTNGCISMGVDSINPQIFYRLLQVEQ
jgi:subtilisin-like proprotein convertase family protein